MTPDPINHFALTVRSHAQAERLIEHGTKDSEIRNAVIVAAAGLVVGMALDDRFDVDLEDAMREFRQIVDDTVEVNRLAGVA